MQQGMKTIGLIFLYDQMRESSFVIQKLESTITLEGKINEAAWKKIDPLPW